MKIAIIPARGGSKRIPGKNIRLFHDRPMIAWPILAARSAGLFDRIVVSTDSDDIARIATECGAEVPFARPAHLSDDFATTTDVIAHAVAWLTGDGAEIEAACCLYATAPLVQAGDLRRGWELLKSGDWKYAFSATDYASPIWRAFTLAENGGVRMLHPEHFPRRSQDLPHALHDAGQFYWGRPAAWLEGARIFDEHSVPVILPRWRVQDIDDMDDWIRAEQVFALMRQGRPAQDVR